MSGTLFGRTTVAVLLVALTALGCGQIEPGGTGEADLGPTSEATMTSQPRDGQPDDTQPDDTQPDDTQPDDTQPDDTQPDDTQPDDGPIDPSLTDRRVAWVPPGPGRLFRLDELDEEVTRWFEAFRERDCDAIAALGPERDQQPLYAGLGDACRAVLEDNDQSWPSAEAALQNVANPTDRLDRWALRLLRDLVMAHQRDPQADIRIVDPPPDNFSPPRTSVTRSPTSVTPTPTSFNSSGASQVLETPSTAPPPSASAS